jgi:hypothetical protein
MVLAPFAQVLRRRSILRVRGSLCQSYRRVPATGTPPLATPHHRHLTRGLWPAVSCGLLSSCTRSAVRIQHHSAFPLLCAALDCGWQGVKLIGGQFGYILQSVTDTKSSICVVTNERWIIEYNLDRFSADVLSAGEISSYIKEIRPVTKTLQCPSKRRLLCSRRKHASLLLVPGLQPREGRCTP